MFEKNIDTLLSEINVIRRPVYESHYDNNLKKEIITDSTVFFIIKKPVKSEINEKNIFEYTCDITVINGKVEFNTFPLKKIARNICLDESCKK